MREKFLAECETLEENGKYTAEAHYILAWVYGWVHRVISTIPAVTAAILGVLVAGDVIPPEYLWLSVFGAAVAAMGSVIDPSGTQEKHLNAARYYTVLKADARTLRNALHLGMTDKEVEQAMLRIHERYTNLVLTTLPTTLWAFWIASRRVKKGIHKPDHEA